ncbi:MAG: hypothetical protein Unbinned2716contig1000_29 [Prokaryotic dsDNA virus sp.]|nr:MAG: hypothetical protein Unbinned2716contig1000_29 [Prokaryotic dsDNA virus sp.]|tara:strand:+ start:13802 stop:14053 length:252 start_codon:yes stop_codon:yes gene_type:complete
MSLDKKTIDDFFNQIDKHYKAPELSYTDVIAIMIKDKLKSEKNLKVGSVQWDLHSEKGYYLSSNKTINVEYSGKEYEIIIKEK